MTRLTFDGYSFHKSGNSLVIGVPPEIRRFLEIEEGNEAVIWVDDHGRIVVEKKKP